MVCQECGKRPVSVHVVRVENGVKREMHLCEVCAKQKNEFDFLDPQLALSQFLSGFFQQPEETEGQSDQAHEGPRCPSCGLYYSEFSKSSQLGCDQCYEAFLEPLQTVVRRIQPGAAHTGKLPRRRGGILESRRQIKRLRLEMKEAVLAEEFEKAAKIRDKIKVLELELETREQHGSDTTPGQSDELLDG